MGTTRSMLYKDVADGSFAEFDPTDDIIIGGLSTSGDIVMNGNRVVDLLDPALPQDSATKAYVDATTAGINVRAANCLAGDSAEDLVYVTGAPVGGLLQVAQIDIEDGAKMPAIGVIVSKSTATDCIVQLHGEFELSSGTLTSGNPVFASVLGVLTTAPPSRPVAGSRLIQHIGIAMTPKKLFIDPESTVHEVRP